MKATAVLLLLLSFLFTQPVWAVEAGAHASGRVSVEDYGLYNRVVEGKFLTSQVQLVLVERMTVSRLSPKQDESMTMAFFQQQGYFDGMLPQDLIRDFVDTNQTPSRLEGRFQFGVRYRFLSGGEEEDSEARAAMFVTNHHAMTVQAPAVLDRLAFSRVGRTLTNHQALVYVENLRRDGTGAGFLVWLRWQGRGWVLFDTEVVWTIHNGEAEDP